MKMSTAVITLNFCFMVGRLEPLVCFYHENEGTLSIMVTGQVSAYIMTGDFQHGMVSLCT